MSQEILITLVIVSLIALVVGFFIGRNIGGSSSDSQALKEAQQALQVSEQALAEYQSNVSEHFGKTADLVDNLTQSYKDVFEHLGGSAKSLLSEEQVKQHLSSRAAKAVTLTYLADEAADKSNPMQAAQQEIQSQTVVDKATQDAEKMAAEIQQNDIEESLENTAESEDNNDKIKGSVT